ncbi:GNAT family N-acetyltransferase [Planosporangium flavigriseum]|nr:GNAT family N-acetyltransferase [Planosporangium flavigriseum]NJC66091.1 GNAT family N-acetyltransferase [Planosporangium flavigriseum]
MLADTPLAFIETLASARRHSDDDWRERAAWADEPHQLGLAAMLADSGRWIAHARCSSVPDLDQRAFIFSVYVAPAFRGRRVADDLFDRVERWAHEEGHPALFLHVHEDNARAIAFYRRRGYDFTGAREPYALDPAQTELEMRLPLR